MRVRRYRTHPVLRCVLWWMQLASLSADVSESSDSDDDPKPDKQKRKNRAHSQSFDALSALANSGGAAQPSEEALLGTAARSQLESLLPSPSPAQDPSSDSPTAVPTSGSHRTVL